MPHEQMNEQAAAAYLHLDIREVIRLASRGRLPCRKVGGKFIFCKGDLDQWVEQRIHEMDGNHLAGIEKAVRQHHGMAEAELAVWPLIPPGGVRAPLKARTRGGAIRDLVALAEAAELVHNRDILIEEIRKREELCSTAIAPGVALPHPRRPMPYDIARSFVVVGLTTSGIPFGAEDGSLTRLFFLICCKDERTHLHVLARLARMLYDKRAVETLIACQDAQQLGQTLRTLEEAAVIE